MLGAEAKGLRTKLSFCVDAQISWRVVTIFATSLGVEQVPAGDEANVGEGVCQIQYLELCHGIFFWFNAVTWLERGMVLVLRLCTYCFSFFLSSQR